MQHESAWRVNGCVKTIKLTCKPVLVCPSNFIRGWEGIDAVMLYAVWCILGAPLLSDGVQLAMSEWGDERTYYQRVVLGDGWPNLQPERWSQAWLGGSSGCGWERSGLLAALEELWAGQVRSFLCSF